MKIEDFKDLAVVYVSTNLNPGDSPSRALELYKQAMEEMMEKYRGTDWDI